MSWVFVLSLWGEGARRAEGERVVLGSLRLHPRLNSHPASRIVDLQAVQRWVSGDGQRQVPVAASGPLGWFRPLT